ncbi:stage II sporulation protein P [Paenibacillus sp. CF384]|uniref:stage II sporulation protein P n=1 Tax=Paenibacillus sp. CF384 TaxID=1884382 RepID=UPI0008975138|nr:stage II sporulation protein P [Paenibacillus sp. CF384]SDW89470.1 stage II sporulation protein P [Paenibacillus sp. CF384]
MKRWIVTLNLAKGSMRLRQLLVAGRTFALLSMGSMILVLVVGIGAIVHQNAASSPVSSMKGFAAAVSGGLFKDMLSMELPGTSDGSPRTAINGRQISTFLFRLLTDINPEDPRSLLASQYPGMSGDTTVILRPGTGTDAVVESGDHDSIPGQEEVGDGSGLPVTDSGRPDHETGDTEPDVTEPDTDAETGEQPTTPVNPPVDTKPDSDPEQVEPVNPSTPTTGGKKVMFIYHSHSRESWFPEISSKKYAESPVKNITLLGKRLAFQLEKSGIGAQQSSTDYVTAIKNYNWLLSYKYSKKTVVDAMAKNNDLQFFFDIHRDSLRRKNTTITINGETYAEVFFIIGLANPNWKKNEALANRMHEALEKKYPGLSRGILGKTTASGNGEYNQSLSPDSVLIEVGGVDNTLKESYRTIDVLAKIISDIYWDSAKVSAQPVSKLNK